MASTPLCCPRWSWPLWPRVGSARAAERCPCVDGPGEAGSYLRAARACMFVRCTRDGDDIGTGCRERCSGLDRVCRVGASHTRASRDATSAPGVALACAHTSS
jgi:hypothetical protein